MITRVLTIMLLLTLALPAQTVPESYSIPNLGIVKDQIEEWVKSDAYGRECSAVNAQARAYLEANLGRVDKPALVLDIDETSLSNYPLMASEDFGFNLERFNAWIDAARTPAIPSTLELYRHAKSRRVAVFFITGRGESHRGATERDLLQAGYKDWNGLYLKPPTYTEPSVVGYKAGVRQQLTAEGWDILVNVGDQFSDLEGGYAESSYKLPNPMYFIP